MAEKSTFVKIDRNIINWRWFHKPNTMLVWLWLILSANIEPHDFEGETIQRGEIATSRNSISAATGLSEQEVRTALKHLKSTGEITSRSRPKYSVITIVEYDKYQSRATSKSTSKQPATNQQSTSNQPQSKNGRSQESPTGKKGKIYMRPPSVADVEAFAAAEGLVLDAQAFVDYNTARGWRGVTDWRPLVRLRAQQLASAAQAAEDDGLDDFGRPRKEYE